jgi:hypothetical protein
MGVTAMTGRKKTTVSRLGYAIERTPAGGFVAVPSDPSMPRLEGSTREEVERQIAAGVEAWVRSQMSRVALGSIARGDRTDGGVAASVGGPLPMPDSERTARIIQTVIGVAVLLGVFWYWAMHH